jgi:hypothetical protein
VRTFVRVGILEPVQDLGFLALGWAWDRPGWSAQWTSMPGAARQTAGQAADHPWDTFLSAGSATLGVEHFRAGRWGAGLGTVAAGVVGGKGLKNVLKGQPVDEDVLARHPNAAFDRRRPLPSTQTLDEMLSDGVDLDRHEHADLGHTLRRHVDVDDDYLEDRLTHGTILDNRRRGDIPPSASAWNDRATAEASINRALRDNEAQVRAFTNGPAAADTHVLKVTTAEPIGRSLQYDPTTGRHVQAISAFVVILQRTPAGVVIHTAYPKAIQ